MMQRRTNLWTSIDWLTVFIYLLLVIMGWISIYAAVYNEEHQSIFDFSMSYGKQLIWISAAIVIAFVIMIIDINFYTYFAYLIYGVLIFMLIAVLLFGKEVNGAKSWFELGSIRIQPAEFAKIATALAIARYLSSYNVQINQFKTYLKLAALILVPSILIFLQNDTGSAIVYFVFILVLYREGISENILLLGFFIVVLSILALVLDKLLIILLLVGVVFIIFQISNKNFKYTSVGLAILSGIAAALYGLNVVLEFNLTYYFIILIGIAVSAIIYVIFSVRKKIRNIFLLLVFLFGSVIYTFSVDYVFNNFLNQYQRNRINVTLGLASDPYGIEYNVNQSKIAIGSGGFTGKGFLRGTQTRFDFVPAQSTDFIFCTIGEEWGFIGTFFVIALFVFFLFRLTRLAERQRSAFSRIYGYGLVSILFFHFVINIGMTIGLIPVIGIPLPFFSYGGSSLWAFTIMLFIFLRLDASRLELL